MSPDEPATPGPMVDRHDVRLSVRAVGALRGPSMAGILQTPDVQVATRLAELSGETDPRATLALALTVRAVRGGSVCLDLRDPAALGLPLTGPPAGGYADPSPGGPAAALAGAPAAALAGAPAAALADGPEPLGEAAADPDSWLDAVRDSALARAGVLRVDHGLIYLERSWQEECLIARVLQERREGPAPLVDETRLAASAALIFPPGHESARVAATCAARRWTTVLTGGPGTGKTTAVAGILALLADLAAGAGGRPLRLALAAPTGKAAARLQEAVAEAAARLPVALGQRIGPVEALTLHRLLGHRPGSTTRFRHDRDNRLPHDLVVVDEASMMSLSMTARLLEALRPDCRLVLVGDPDQLTSVDAGAVLADLVEGAAVRDPGAVAVLGTSHRFGAHIAELAACVRSGDADAVMSRLAKAGPGVTWLDPAAPDTGSHLRAAVLAGALGVRRAGERGDPAAALVALDAHRLLCAHRDGPVGAAQWNRRIEQWLAEAEGLPLGAASGTPWYAGRPVLVTANDYGLGLFNGDTGVALADPEGGLRVVFAGAPGRSWAPARLAEIDTMHALTVHKSQGGQAREVTVLLPDVDSPLLTRQLLYTALTRAQERVRLVGTEAAIRAAVCRPARRASGLRRRLGGPAEPRGT